MEKTIQDTLKCPNCGFSLKNKVFKPRSLEQNNSYWGLLVEPLSEHFGYFKDEMHEILKMKFWWQEKLVDNEWVKIPKSTTKMSTVDMNRYYDDIINWAGSIEIVLQKPNEEHLES